MDRIKDIEDYCKNLPQTHVWQDLSLKSGDEEKLRIIIIEYLELLTKNSLSQNAIKSQLQRKYHIALKPAHINIIYQKMLSEGSIQRSLALENAMITKVCRGISGVTVVTVFLSPYPDGQQFSCKWNCHYCPNEPGQPRSYLFGEPGVLRANQQGFDCVAQIRNRIQSYVVNGHPIDKFEILVLGGTIHSYPNGYLERFMRDIYYGANTCLNTPENEPPRDTLEEEQKRNSTGSHKVIGLTIETRPDCINVEELLKFRRWGVTRVQLGVQHTDDSILRAVNRGHGYKHVNNAMQMLRDACFKVDIHLMPNLPTSTPDKDRKMFDTVLSELHPDQVKIYPCETTPFTQILEDYKSGKYVPYSDDELKEVVIYWKSHVHPWIRNNRIVRDIPNQYIVAGVPSSSERCVYQAEMKRRGLVCRCIRCREAGRHNDDPSDGHCVIRHYEAHNGNEYFISWENADETVLYGFCRLRITNNFVFKSLSGLGLIRELHVYGRTFATGTDNSNSPSGNVTSVQHTGIGKKLLQMAEHIAWENNCNGTAVIAGIGTRGYYRRFGYVLGDVGDFMQKRFLYSKQLYYNILGLFAIFLTGCSIFSLIAKVL
jgi:ELP3 family radical SAM enzyme/protein acetyltransferase